MISEYETTDFWLAVFLKARGLRILTLKKNGKQCIFVFENQERREQLIKEFYTDELIRFNAVKRAAQDLRSMMHNFTGELNANANSK